MPNTSLPIASVCFNLLLVGLYCRRPFCPTYILLDHVVTVPVSTSFLWGIASYACLQVCLLVLFLPHLRLLRFTSADTLQFASSASSAIIALFPFILPLNPLSTSIKLLWAQAYIAYLSQSSTHTLTQTYAHASAPQLPFLLILLRRLVNLRPLYQRSPFSSIHLFTHSFSFFV